MSQELRREGSTVNRGDLVSRAWSATIFVCSVEGVFTTEKNSTHSFVRNISLRAGALERLLSFEQLTTNDYIFLDEEHCVLPGEMIESNFAALAIKELAPDLENMIASDIEERWFNRTVSYSITAIKDSFSYKPATGIEF